LECASAVDSETARRLRRSISVTTRPPRPEEVEGVHYFFRTREQFDQLTREGGLLEWATYLDHAYGTPGEWVDQQLAAGYDVVLEIEVQGALQVRANRPEAALVYMLPPSWEELHRRLAGRGTDSEETRRRRIEVAHQEVDSVDQYDYAIVNDRVECAASRLLAIIEAEHWRVSRLER
jgi:guanylate kinase